MRLIQITDCHLGANAEDTLLGMNTTQSLVDVLALVRAENSAVDAILCAGDIANHSDLVCYPKFVEIVRQYFSVPLAWIPGNHDDSAIMQREYPNLAERRLLNVGAWQVVLLDSSVPECVHGEISTSELAFLRAALDAAPNTPTMVALHHQPVPVGSAWIDKYIVVNAAELLAVLAEYPQVKCVTFGHVHQEFLAQYAHFSLYATPSTCIQFKPGCEDFTVDSCSPGYRWFDLQDDGSFTTGISRVNKAYILDTNSQGY